MQIADTSRRLIWYGILLFLLGLLTGAVLPALANPRMGLSAHLGGVMTGMFLVIVGLVWKQFPPSSAARSMFWLALYGSYVSWGALLVAACLGTASLTPIAGAGHGAAPWRENLVSFGLVTSSVAMVLFTILLLRQVGRRERT